jgi:hypothetical protein
MGTAAEGADLYRSIDGGHLQISGQSVDLSEPWSASIEYFHLGHRAAAFLSGPLDNWAAITVLQKDFGFLESYSYQGGRLRIGWGTADASTAPPERAWLASWEGTAFSLAAIQMSRSTEPPDFLTRFENFDIRETPHGIVLDSRYGPEFEPRASEVVKHIPELGVVSIVRADSAQSLVPSEEGTPVDGGELLVGDSSVTTIQPLEEPVESEARLAVLDHFVVTWS